MALPPTAHWDHSQKHEHDRQGVYWSAPEARLWGGVPDLALAYPLLVKKLVVEDHTGGVLWCTKSVHGKTPVMQWSNNH